MNNYSKKQNKNPKNQVLRQDGQKEENILDGLPLLQNRTRCIHIGWLFDIKGKSALMNLCRSIDSTIDHISIPGWKDLAFQLHLDSLLVGCIENRRFLGETETYYTLLAAAQHNDRTLSDLLEALKLIGRLDALQESWESIECLATEVLENEERSGSTLHSEVIIKPPYIPVPPATVLQSDSSQYNSTAVTLGVIQALVQTEAFKQKIIQYKDQPRCENVLVENAVSPVQQISLKQSNTRRMHYDCTIMLTFASDGEKYIQNIVESLRKERPDGQRIGVLVLEEHSSMVELNHEEFIKSVFNQVNYIMPVITYEYLKSVGISSPVYHTTNNYIDTNWTKYIYTLMNVDYVKQGCLNFKVRCLVPDELLHLTQTHRRMGEPIFQSWHRVSDIENVGHKLLASIKQKKLRTALNPKMPTSESKSNV